MRERSAQPQAPANENGPLGTGPLPPSPTEIPTGKRERSPDEDRKTIMRTVLIDPFAKAGYDFDETLKDFAVRLLEGTLPRTQAADVMRVMRVYGGQVADLARWGLIKEETRDLVNRALRR